ncbi:MAG: hypothetical protein B7Z72_06365 [Gemmatimonadetes bacterium 21-71-4]|nr:MAG: hypothetical protein B7Z72_06365 [Gemmatimonadetes bacterium 21-71-4]
MARTARRNAIATSHHPPACTSSERIAVRDAGSARAATHASQVAMSSGTKSAIVASRIHTPVTIR